MEKGSLYDFRYGNPWDIAEAMFLFASKPEAVVIRKASDVCVMAL